MQLKMYFFVPFVRPCMHHNYGVTSGSLSCSDCIWPAISDAELYRPCPRERVLVAICFNVILYSYIWSINTKMQVLVSRRFRKVQQNIVACFDAVRLFVFVPIPWPLQSHFTLWISARTLQCLFDWWRVMSQITFAFYLDSTSLGIAILLCKSTVSSVTFQLTTVLRMCL